MNTNLKFEISRYFSRYIERSHLNGSPRIVPAYIIEISGTLVRTSSVKTYEFRVSVHYGIVPYKNIYHFYS